MTVRDLLSVMRVSNRICIYEYSELKDRLIFEGDIIDANAPCLDREVLYFGSEPYICDGRIAVRTNITYKQGEIEEDI